MKLVDYLTLVRERLVIVLLVIVVSVATVVGFTLLQDPRYEASVRLRARPAAAGSQASDIVEERAEQTDLGTETELVRSTAVAEAVAEELGLAGDPTDLLDDVRVSVVPNTAVLLVTASAADGDQAIALANAFAEQYLVNRRAVVTQTLDEETARQSERVQQLVDRLTELDEFLDGVDPDSSGATAAQAERTRVFTDLIDARSRLDAVADRAALAAGFGEVIQAASDANPVRATSIPRAAVFGVLLGIPLSLAVTLLLDSLSNAIRSRDDAERAAGVDVIGVVPSDPRWNDATEARLTVVADPFSGTAEGYRALGYTLLRSLRQTGCSSVLVTSASGGDGKTATVANLAVSTADAGTRCRVLDADLRNGRLHAFLGVAQEPGLADVLAGESALDTAVVALGTSLNVLPSGRRSDRPDLLVSRTDVGATIRRLADDQNLEANGSATGVRPRPPGSRAPLRAARPAATGDGQDEQESPLVFVDSAPILEAAEVSRLVASVDAVLLVARVRVTSKQALAAAAEQVRRSGGSIVGVVLIGGTITQAASTADAPRSAAGQAAGVLVADG